MVATGTTLHCGACNQWFTAIQVLQHFGFRNEGVSGFLSHTNADPQLSPSLRRASGFHFSTLSRDLPDTLAVLIRQQRGRAPVLWSAGPEVLAHHMASKCDSTFTIFTLIIRSGLMRHGRLRPRAAALRFICDNSLAEFEVKLL